MSNAIMVEVQCLKSTAADIDYYEAGRIYTIGMAWAKKRGIWKYFEPVREVSENEVGERAHERTDALKVRLEERARVNEESVAQLEEAQA